MEWLRHLELTVVAVVLLKLCKRFRDEVWPSVLALSLLTPCSVYLSVYQMKIHEPPKNSALKIP